MEDVIKVVDSCMPYLITLGVILVLALIMIVGSKKMQVAYRKLVRLQVGVAVVLAGRVRDLFLTYMNPYHCFRG
jgi:galactitol-specific phosphotransferase system IIC component